MAGDTSFNYASFPQNPLNYFNLQEGGPPPSQTVILNIQLIISYEVKVRFRRTEGALSFLMHGYSILNFPRKNRRQNVTLFS